MCIPHKAKIHQIVHSPFLPPKERIRLLNQKRGVSPVRPEPCTSQTSPFEKLFLIMFIVFIIILIVLMLINDIWALFYVLGFVCGSFYYWLFFHKILKGD